MIFPTKWAKLPMHIWGPGILINPQLLVDPFLKLCVGKAGWKGNVAIPERLMHLSQSAHVCASFEWVGSLFQKHPHPCRLKAQAQPFSLCIISNYCFVIGSGLFSTRLGVQVWSPNRRPPFLTGSCLKKHRAWVVSVDCCACFHNDMGRWIPTL